MGGKHTAWGVGGGSKTCGEGAWVDEGTLIIQLKHIKLRKTAFVTNKKNHH